MRNILMQYLEWHFSDVPSGIIKGWRNFLVFNLNFFSINLLLKTFFKPWRRYKEGYSRGLDIQKYFETFMFNLISRGIGMIMRAFMIALGLAIETFILVSGLALLLLWLMLPALLVGSIWISIMFLT